MESTSRSGRGVLPPTRRDGHQRVASLLDAAAAVIGERGFEAATMSEIAARADARIGSLYRFFPDKEAVAEALIQRYTTLVLDTFAQLRPRVAGMTGPALADLLIDQLVALRPQAGAMTTLLDTRVDGDRIRLSFRERIIFAIADLLQLNAPFLAVDRVPDIAAVLLNGMKTMAGLHTGEAPGGPGARDELRVMTRLYLADRLRPPARGRRPARLIDAQFG